jgi:thymidylate kinase
MYHCGVPPNTPADIVIFLQVSTENLKQRIKNRNSIDIDSSLERTYEMNNAYKEISSKKIIKKLCHVKWIYVDGNRRKDDVYDEVCKVILKCLTTS